MNIVDVHVKKIKKSMNIFTNMNIVDVHVKKIKKYMNIFTNKNMHTEVVRSRMVA